ncbi:hypothetical protein KHS38_15190 [Mucilaginibacter sp. Bleaf8]|uniref:hypothetical protein n=1 Tax=Mucilaginibacter sp. Bleaf8 TaxID=2834430 RepID=UPI001BCAB17C|nr:hypothetical protein [Mucilaginibacter sp. Bleaf8]MBS7565752.1 hypothetical protein [Mucilaginibacter sp. Bleaf8]
MRRRYILIILLTVVLTAIVVYTTVYFSAKPAQLAGVDTANTFYQHKVIPVVVQNEIKAALSYYPELKETSIHFVFDPNTSKSIMLSQPVLGSIFRGQTGRAYVVKINPNFVMAHGSMPIQNVPKDILVGWFGHELGHITDYTHRSNANMILFGLRYVCSDYYLMQAERNADGYAVEHGLADYIIKTKNFILHTADLPQAYKDRIKKLYLSPQQIMDMTKKLKKDPDTTHIKSPAAI